MSRDEMSNLEITETVHFVSGTRQKLVSGNVNAIVIIYITGMHEINIKNASNLRIRSHFPTPVVMCQLVKKYFF